VALFDSGGVQMTTKAFVKFGDSFKAGHATQLTKAGHATQRACSTDVRIRDTA
jgi:hypothetical protein